VARRAGRTRIGAPSAAQPATARQRRRLLPRCQLRCEVEAVPVSDVVDAFVLCAEAEAPAGVEVAVGDDGAQPEDGPGGPSSPYRAPVMFILSLRCAGGRLR